MSNTYVIQWKSKLNGRAGRGSKVFSREEAEMLAEELNLDYPDIVHEAIPVPAPQADSVPASTHQAAAASEEEEEALAIR